MTREFKSTRTKHKRRPLRALQSPPGAPGIRTVPTVGQRYLLTMSIGDDTDRDQLFMDWVGGVIRQFKTQGWTRERVAEAGDVSRNQLYQWEGRGKKGFSRPHPDKVRTFCEGLGIPWELPFRIMGWDTSGRRHTPPQPEVKSEIDRRIGLLLVALDLPGISDDERRELDVQLARLRATQRMNEDAIKAADEALKRHGAA